MIGGGGAIGYLTTKLGGGGGIMGKTQKYVSDNLLRSTKANQSLDSIVPKNVIKFITCLSRLSNQTRDQVSSGKCLLSLATFFEKNSRESQSLALKMATLFDRRKQNTTVLKFEVSFFLTGGYKIIRDLSKIQKIRKLLELRDTLPEA